MTAALNTQITKTSSEWVTDNPILGKDIIGVEITPGNTLRYKRGDGITTWDGLNYIDIAGDYITAETDPTVPAWAKETSKPTYTASEVGAAPLSHANDTDIHVSTAEKTSWNSKAAGDHNHDNVYQPIGSYLTSESDPTVPSWAKQIDIRIYTASEVGAAAASHNHDTAYAPISHSNDSSIHVTATDKTNWNNKANSDHVHSASDITNRNFIRPPWRLREKFMDGKSDSISVVPYSFCTITISNR